MDLEKMAAVLDEGISVRPGDTLPTSGYARRPPAGRSPRTAHPLR
jgi:hypothetical protein